MKLLTNFVNYSQLLAFFIYSNRKSLLINSIGLIIALSCVAEAQIYIDSVQGRIVDDFLEDDGKLDHFDLSVEAVRLIKSGSINQSLLESNQNPLYEAMAHTGTSKYLFDEVWSIKYRVNAFFPKILPENSYSIRNTTIHSFSNDLLQDLSPLMTNDSRIPVNVNEVIMLNFSESMQTFANIAVGSFITARSGSDPGVNKTLEIVGVINLDFGDTESETYQKLAQETGNKDLLNVYWNDYCFITTNEILYNLLEDYRDFLPSEGYSRYNTEIIILGRIFFKRYLINLFAIDDEKAIFSQLYNSMVEQYTELTALSTNINFFLLDVLDLFRVQTLEMITFLLLFSLPIIGIALFLVIYSFGLIKQKKNITIGLLKSKGLSIKEITSFLIFEKVFELLITIPVAFFIAIPLSIIGLSSDDFLSFGNTEFHIIINAPKIFLILIVVGILFSFLVNFRYFSSFIKSEVLTITKPIESKKTEAFWKKNYIDILILTIGCIGFFLLYLGAVSSDLPGEAYTLVHFIGVPSPFFLIIGSSMFVARLFPRFLQLLSNILWRIEGGIISFSVKNMLNHKHAVTRSVILIMLTASFGAVALTIPATLDNHYYHMAEYYTGADIFVRYEEDKSVSGRYPELENIMSNIQEFEEYSPIVIQNRFARNAHYLMMGIDLTNYDQVAFSGENYKLSDTLTNLMEELTQEDSILLRTTDMNRMSKKIGETITLQSKFYNYTSGRDEVMSQKQLTIVGSFKYWPNLVTFETTDVEDGIFFVGNISIAKDLEETLTETKTEYGYYIRTIPETDIQNIAQELLETTNLEVNNVVDNKKDYVDSSIWYVFLGVLNTNIVIAFLTASISIVMFAYNQIIGREKEIGIEKALGMDFNQSFRLIFTEGILLMGFGLILGAILGLIISITYMFVVTIRNLIPPFLMIYPVNYISMMLLGFAIITTIGSAIPAYLSTKIEVDKALKVE